MNVELAKPLISNTQADIENLSVLTQTEETADKHRFSILASIQAIESDMKRLRKLVTGY
jgi:hypothetical protein